MGLLSHVRANRAKVGYQTNQAAKAGKDNETSEPDHRCPRESAPQIRTPFIHPFIPTHPPAAHPNQTPIHAQQSQIVTMNKTLGSEILTKFSALTVCFPRMVHCCLVSGK